MNGQELVTRIAIAGMQNVMQDREQRREWIGRRYQMKFSAGCSLRWADGCYIGTAGDVLDRHVEYVRTPACRQPQRSHFHYHCHDRCRLHTQHIGSRIPCFRHTQARGTCDSNTADRRASSASVDCKEHIHWMCACSARWSASEDPASTAEEVGH